MVTGANLTSAGNQSYKLFALTRFFEFLGGVLSLLDEPEEDVKVFALNRLNELVDEFWAEISESIAKM